VNVSVIIAVFNAEKYLDKSIQSALDQKETGEVILIDDRSTDGSLDICKKWDHRDPRIKIFFNEGVKGCGASRNIGLKNASCDFVTFLDADDYFYPDRFQGISSIFSNNPAVDGVASCIIMEKSNEKILIGPSTTNKRLTYVDHIKDQNFSLVGLTFRRSVLDDLGCFNEAFLLSQDQEFIYRLLRDYNVVGSGSTTPIVHYRIHPNNSTANTQNVNYYGRKVWKDIFWKSMKDRQSKKVLFETLKKYIENDYNLLIGVQWPVVKKCLKVVFMPIFISRLIWR
jgi:glycosyltransferase involved in cell wall biosynthesis